MRAFMYPISQRKKYICSVLCSLAAIIPGLLVYSRLPQRFAIRFSFSGQASGFTSPILGIFLVPVLCTLLQVVIFWLDSRDTSASDPKARRLLLVIFPLLSWCISTILLLVNLYPGMEAVRCILVAVGGLLLLLAAFVYDVRPNAWFGVRTAATRSSLIVWKKANRMAAFVLTALGLLGCLCALLLPDLTAWMVFLAGTLTGSIYLVVYAAKEARKDQPENP